MLAWPGSGAKVVFLCAEETPELSRLPSDTLFVEHSKTLYDRLAGAGRRTSPAAGSGEGEADAVFLLVPKQAEEARARIAEGIGLLKDGGIFVCAAANDAGGTRLAKTVGTLGLSVRCESKHKARVVWACVSRSSLDLKLLEEFQKQGELRRASHGMFSFPGLFGWDKVDAGSEMLACLLPSVMKGNGADFGCGYGYLSRELSPKMKGGGRLYCLDADFRAVNACRKNMEGSGIDAEFVWEDMRRWKPPYGGLDWIVMNPPFHSAKQVSIHLGRECIEAAASSLRRGGDLWMVANSHLPYEKILKDKFSDAVCVEESRGFKIFRAVR